MNMQRRQMRSAPGAPMAKKPIVMATDESRALFNFAKAQLKKAGNKKAILSQGYLRFEVLLSQGAVATATSQIRFGVLSNDTTNGPIALTEQRLNPSDAFLVDRAEFMLGVGLTANGPGGINYQNFESASILGAANVVPARIVYNGGRLFVKRDSVVQINGIDMRRFRYVGTAQDGVAPSVGDLWDGSAWNFDDASRRVIPSIWLNGGSTNEVTIDIKNTIPASFNAGANNDLKCALIFYGLLAQNAGEFNPANYER